MKALCLVLLAWSACTAAGEDLERINSCSTKCTKGLQCKTKLKHYLFPPRCKNPASGLSTRSVFKNVSLSAVMSCRQRRDCSLHLQIETLINLTDSIHGLYICTATPATFSRCQIVTFSKASRERMSGQQVDVKNDCVDLQPHQQVQVTLETWPPLCDITWTGTYQAPGCLNEDLRRNIPECITGQLSYKDDPQKKELSVVVSESLDDKNYNLRLCKKSTICFDAGAKVVIKKEDAVKRAILRYTLPLPCLCIEGWCDMIDAPRIQVCPFQDRLEELWRGITFNPLEQMLQWEPACPVAAVVSLCQKGPSGVCSDLSHQSSRRVGKEKVAFAEVDPHPLLCMKFTVKDQSWIRCPFGQVGLPVWQVTFSEGELSVFSYTNATFLLEVCQQRKENVLCQPYTHAVHVEPEQSVRLNLSEDVYRQNVCLQMKRVDVKFSVTSRCFQPGDKPPAAKSVKKELADTKYSLICISAGVTLTVLIALGLVLHVVVTAHHRRKQKRKATYFAVEKQTGEATPGVSLLFIR
ncbi:interleukin-17 receptor E-like protein [Synchiropus picturatus]